MSISTVCCSITLRQGRPFPRRPKSHGPNSVERAKIELTEFTLASVHLPGATKRLTRDDTERILLPVFEEKCDGPLHVALNPKSKGALGPRIDHVLLIGGPTKMHAMRKYLRKALAREGVRQAVVDTISLDPSAPGEVDPMNCVSEGAAALAHMGATAAQKAGTAGRHPGPPGF